MKIESYLTLMGLLLFPLFLNAQSYKSLWKKVDDAVEKNFPKTVMQHTQEIYDKAEKENNIGQLYKAGVYYYTMQMQIEPDSLITMVVKGEQRIQKIQDPIEKALMHSLLAETYFEAGNRYRSYAKTAVDESLDPLNLESWGGNQIVQAILQHLDASLRDKEVLVNVSGEDYVPFIEIGETSRYFNHDLYHVLAQRRIEMLNSLLNRYFYNEWDGEYGKESVRNYLDEAYDEFIQVYKDSDKEAAQLFVQLARWNREIKNEESIEQLNQWIKQYADLPEVVEVYLAKATYYQHREPKKGMDVCDEALNLYPDYYRINAIKEIKSQILTPQLRVSVANLVYPEKEVELNVTHKNLKGFKLQWYLIDPANYDKELSEEKLLAQSKLHSTVEFQLVPPSDYKATDTLLTLTAPPMGRYLLCMETEEEDNGRANISVITSSSFKGVSFYAYGKEHYELTVVDAETGYPVPNAWVSFFDRTKKLIEKLETNAKGQVTISREKGSPVFYRVVKGEDQAMDYQNLTYNQTSINFMAPHDQEKKEIKLVTDRAIYRPGQTVYVKGIAYAQEEGKYTVIPNRPFEVRFYDAARKEIGKESVTTNEYGSFTLTFPIPSVTLNGMFSVSTPYGEVAVRVEEYKRPSFELVFDTLKTSYQLGDEVLLTGKAKTFSGIPITENEVEYTLTRDFQFWRFSPSGRSVLAQGKVALNEKGEFEIPVELLSNEEDPIWGFYVYTVEVSLTNVAGETQTQRFSLSAGKRSLFIHSGLSETICKDQPVTTVLKAVNLNRNDVLTTVKVALYKRGEEKEWREVAADRVYAQEYTSNESITLDWESIPSGAYKLLLLAEDDRKREVRFEQDIRLFSLNDSRPPVDEGIWLYTLNTDFDEDTPAKFALGTADTDVCMFYNVYDAKKQIRSEQLQFSNSFEIFEIPYLPEYGDGLVVVFTYVKNSEIYQVHKELKRKIEENPIQVKREVFRDRLTPGQKEEWKFVLLDKEGEPVDAEFLALMYDASLDQLWKNDPVWKLIYRPLMPYVYSGGRYTPRAYIHLGFNRTIYKVTPLLYDSFFSVVPMHYRANGILGLSSQAKSTRVGAPVLLSVEESAQMEEVVFHSVESLELSEDRVMQDAMADSERVEEAGANLRSNFAETAFFYPQLKTNEKGEILFSFTVPEQLTRWNFKGYAHSKEMGLGELMDYVVTVKDFSIQPYFPRFVRQSDRVVLSSVLTNQSGAMEKGTVSFVLFDPFTEKVIKEQKQPFSVEANVTQSVSFTFDVPEEYNLLGCRIIAKGKTFSDGEQQVIPILERRIALVESETFIVRNEGEVNVPLNKLFNEDSPTASNKKMTLEFSGNPIWLAIQSLPSLQQPQSENAISWVASLYAGQVAAYILNGNPMIKTTLEAWQKRRQESNDLLTPLLKNPELKQILLEESPWLLEANTEEQQQARLQTLFNLNQVTEGRLAAELRLKELQQSDGAWSWFQGMYGNKFVTAFVMESLIRLEKLTGQEISPEIRAMKAKAADYLHWEGKKEYERLNKDKIYGISNTGLSYLYLVALGELKVPKKYEAAYAHLLSLVPKLLNEGTIAQKAKAAYVLNYNGKVKEAKDFLASLKEYLVQTEEKGMYFSQLDRASLQWDQQKIASHVYALEAFDEIAQDKEVVDEMKLWLLSQKRTQQWDTPIETVNAVYALLCRGRDDFSAEKKITITWDKETVDVQKASVLPSVAYVKREIQEKGQGGFPLEIKIKQENEGMAWGAVYAQFQEDLDQVKTHGKELKVEKKLYVERMEGKNKLLKPLEKGDSLMVGEVVVSRLILSSDRALDFVHLKDQKAACFEPVQSLSGYRWSGSFNYYLDEKDAATHYYLDYFPKGVLVVESSYRVARSGEYEGGIAKLQSAYAPEFASYAASQRVVVKEDSSHEE